MASKASVNIVMEYTIIKGDVRESQRHINPACRLTRNRHVFVILATWLMTNFCFVAFSNAEQICSSGIKMAVAQPGSFLQRTPKVNAPRRSSVRLKFRLNDCDRNECNLLINDVLSNQLIVTARIRLESLKTCNSVVAIGSRQISQDICDAQRLEFSREITFDQKPSSSVTTSVFVFYTVYLGEHGSQVASQCKDSRYIDGFNRVFAWRYTTASGNTVDIFEADRFLDKAGERRIDRPLSVTPGHASSVE